MCIFYLPGLHPPGPPLARPILPRERGALDRIVEYLVGDGPQNRYCFIRVVDEGKWKTLSGYLCVYSLDAP